MRITLLACAVVGIAPLVISLLRLSCHPSLHNLLNLSMSFTFGLSAFFVASISGISFVTVDHFLNPLGLT